MHPYINSKPRHLYELYQDKNGENLGLKPVKAKLNFVWDLNPKSTVADRISWKVTYCHACRLQTPQVRHRLIRCLCPGRNRRSNVCILPKTDGCVNHNRGSKLTSQLIRSAFRWVEDLGLFQFPNKICYRLLATVERIRLPLPL